MIEVGKYIDLPDLSSERLPPGMNEIIQFAQSHMPEKSKWPGKWYPVYHGDLTRSIPYLYRILNHIKTHVTGADEKPLHFFDFGGGHGVVTALAVLAGFRGINVEIHADQCEAAEDFAKQLAAQEIIRSDSMSIVHGSYYTSDAWEWIRALYENSFQNDPTTSFFELLAFDTKNRRDHLNKIPRDQVSKLAGQFVIELLDELTPSAGSLERTGWLNNHGKLPAGSIVYSYLSDPFCEVGGALLEEFRIILEPGSLVLLAESGQLMSLWDRGEFDDFGFLGAYKPMRDKVSLEQILVFQTPTYD